MGYITTSSRVSRLRIAQPEDRSFEATILTAVPRWQPVAGSGLPCFRRDDIAAIADFIERHGQR